MARPTPRQNRALAAMRAYTGNDRWPLGGPEVETDLTDLLADLMHLLGPERVEDGVAFAAWHFKAETTGEEG
jgi:hypothetical protein